MTKIPSAAGLAATLLLCEPAIAQERPGPFITEQAHTSLRVSKLTGVDVIGQDHVKLGEIEEVLVSRDGRVEAVVVGTGGLFGLGGKTIALPYDQILWNTGDVSRAQSPSASLSPENAPPAEPAEAAADRMPGVGVSEGALNAVPEGRSGVVDPATGPVTTGAIDRPATVMVTGAGAPEGAEVRLTRADIAEAPEFRYAGDRESR
jgi:sporulation protein YlmC with PRC-barrel domain